MTDEPVPMGSLIRRIYALGPDERRVLLFLLRRLEVGYGRYGYLDLMDPDRDFRREQSEEESDLIIYAACESLRKYLASEVKK